MYFLIAGVMLASVVLTACGGQDTQAPEPNVTGEEIIVTGLEQLDPMFTGMLENMSGYNKVFAYGLLTEMVEDNPPFILDVRTAAEVAEQGHIAGAAHIPLNELAKDIDQLPSLDTPIVTYCLGGWRSTIAMTALQAMGWEDVRVLIIRFADWKKGGYPIAAGIPEDVILDAANPEASLVQAVDRALSGIRDMGYGVIIADELNTELFENPEMILIDVRTMGEVEEKGLIASEDQELLIIPLEEFIDKKAQWPKNKETKIVVYCARGYRSTVAVTILLSYGYSDVFSLSGGFDGWVEVGYPVVEYAAP